jgi:anti-sigma B factor antagonist
MTGELADVPVVVTLPDEIDFTNADDAEAALLEARDYPGLIIADMSGTTFCDSMGVRMLTVTCVRAAAAGSDFRVVVTRGGPVARMLAITGIDRIVPVYASLRDAVTDATGGRLGPAGDDAAP